MGLNFLSEGTKNRTRAKSNELKRKTFFDKIDSSDT